MLSEDDGQPLQASARRLPQDVYGG